MREDILNGLICLYCKSKTELVDSSEIYGKSYGKIYLCRPCDAYVGVHRGSDLSLGRLANYRLRELKKEAHFYFDQIAKTNLINKIFPKFLKNISNRSKAYIWLSEQMNIDPEECHIGMFDEKQCEKVIKISKKEIEKWKTSM